MKEKNLLFKRAMLALCLLAVCWLPMRAEVMPGDVNSDGEVSIADVAKLIDYLLTDDVSMINMGNADVNKDGQVDIADVASLIDVLLLMTSEPQQQEHEWVDLGLPSGTLWATRNVGASAPEEYGDYFAWGETAPKEVYNWDTYKWGRYDYSNCKYYLTKYNTNSVFGTVDNKTELDPSDDAAYVNWGPSWRMPTFEQQNELYDNCSWTWTTRNGVNGRLVTGPNGNTMFLPAAGNRVGSSLGFAGSNGFYWSRTLDSDGPCGAYFLEFYSGRRDYWDIDNRGFGVTVRAVRVSQN